MSARSYLPEVDGLRAFAVGAVLLFHAFPSALPGGFIGVDIFFVVSGFVISRTYLDRLASRETSLRRFYLKRIRRLAPAYALVLCVSTVAALALLSPRVLKSFGTSLLAQPFYAQNITFWIQGDYFDGALQKPLLHTWSLAVEEQFYVLFGAAILVARWRRRALWPLLILSSAVSVAAGLAVGVSTAFYLVPTRVWEFAAGIAAFEIARRLPPGAGGPSALAAAFVATAGLVVSVAAFDETHVFPGLQAALATLCVVALLVLFEARPAAGYAPFRVPALRRVGELSYSLYLWHWPVIVFLSVWLGRSLAWGEATAALALSVVLSELTYRTVENPVRLGSRLTATPALLRAWLASSAAFAIGGLALILSGGALFRYGEPVRTLYAAAQDSSPARCPLAGRLLSPSDEMCPANEAARSGSRARPGLLLLGDSHADQLDEPLGAAGDRLGIPVYITVRHCDLDEFGDDPTCSGSILQAVLDQARARGVGRVLAVSSWGRDEPTVAMMTGPSSSILDAGLDLVLSETIPESDYFDPELRAEAILAGTPPAPAYTRREYVDATRRQRGTFARLAADHPGRVTVLHPGTVLCPGDMCAFATDGAPNYFDSGHVTRHAADQLMSVYTRALR